MATKKSSKNFRSGGSGRYVPSETALTDKPGHVAEPRVARKRPGVPARFAALRDDETATVILSGEEQVIYVPRASLPTKAGIGDDLVLRFELPDKKHGS